MGPVTRPLTDAPVALGRLTWACRRGMRELDVLLERFLREEYARAEHAEQQAFEALLALPDPLIVEYLQGEAQPSDPMLAALAGRLTRRGADT